MEGIVYLAEFQWPKKCAKCGKQIDESTAGWWNKNIKPAQYYHTDCYSPNASSTGPKVTSSQGAAPNSRQANPSPSGAAKIDSATAEKTTSDNFMKAIAFIEAQVPNAQEYQNYLDAVTEYARQLNNNQWLEIEKRKIRVA